METADITKVAMNLSRETINDVNQIMELSGSSPTKTAVVANAIRAYKAILEMQKEGSIILYKKKGQKIKVTFKL